MIKEVFAQDIKIKEPGGIGIPAFTPLSTIIGNLIGIIMTFGALAVLAMFVWGAFEWVTSGGDKEQVASARGKIINAVIGLVILAVSFVIARVAGDIVGIDILNLSIPSLSD